MKNYEEIFRKDMTGSEQSIYRYLLFRQGHNNSCYPSHKKISRDCRLSVSTVKRCISSLESKGYVIKINRRRANGGKTSNVYICG